MVLFSQKQSKLIMQKSCQMTLSSAHIWVSQSRSIFPDPNVTSRGCFSNPFGISTISLIMPSDTWLHSTRLVITKKYAQPRRARQYKTPSKPSCSHGQPAVRCCMQLRTDILSPTVLTASLSGILSGFWVLQRGWGDDGGSLCPFCVPKCLLSLLCLFSAG